MVEVTLESLEDLIERTKDCEKLANKVLENPTDENLLDYNNAIEWQYELKLFLNIYPIASTAEKAASEIWRARKNKLLKGIKSL